MDQDKLERIMQLIREDIPTNNISSGNIEPATELGDDPIVRKKKKKKKYAYGGHGSRKTWMPSKTFEQYTEGVAALAPFVPKVIPALMTGIGAAGTFYQAMKRRAKIPKYKQKFIDNQLKDTPKRTGGETFDTKDLKLNKKPKSNIITPKDGQVMQDSFVPEGE